MNLREMLCGNDTKGVMGFLERHRIPIVSERPELLKNLSRLPFAGVVYVECIGSDYVVTATIKDEARIPVVACRDLDTIQDFCAWLGATQNPFEAMASLLEKFQASHDNDENKKAILEALRLVERSRSE